MKIDKIDADEWHAFWMGWGDGAALKKGESTHENCCPPLELISREAWYYKVGVGVGRLTWIPAIAWLVWLVMRWI